MKKIIAIALMMVSCFALAKPSGDFLFLQTASKGQLVKNADNSYTLTLKNVPAYVGYFSDRPERKTGIISLKKFLDLWDNNGNAKGFAKVPPNAAVVIKTFFRKPQNFVAIISKPVYADNSVSYQLKIISKSPIIMTGRLTHINMFFDDVPWNPGGY